MKNLLLSLLSLLLFFFGCSEGDRNAIYPMKREISDFTLTEASCNWQNTEKDTVYLINSDEELSKYVFCQSNILPAIDFDKYSLLFVRGVNTSGIHSITHDLQQISLTEYRFVIDITSDMTAIVQVWSVAILTPKLPNNSVVKLDLRKH